MLVAQAGDVDTYARGVQTSRRDHVGCGDIFVHTGIANFNVLDHRIWLDWVDPLRLLGSLLEMWDVPKAGRCTG